MSAWVYPYGDIAVTTGLLAGMQNSVTKSCTSSVAIRTASWLLRRDKQRLVPLQPVELWKDPNRAKREAVSVALHDL